MKIDDNENHENFPCNICWRSWVTDNNVCGYPAYTLAGYIGCTSCPGFRLLSKVLDNRRLDRLCKLETGK